MSEAFKRAGILYGRLGLATPAAIIEGRYPGIEAAAKALTLEQLPELLFLIFGRTAGLDEISFFDHFRTDPTFDVRAADKEAALLAIAIADYAMTEDMDVGGEVALSVVTASVGGTRRPVVASEILSIADEVLVSHQEGQEAPPSKRTKLGVPGALTNAIEAVRGQTPQHNYLPQIMPAIVAAFEQTTAFVTATSNQAATIHNSLLAHIAKLEEQTQTHWWVTGGWSEDANSLFRDLSVIEAAIRGGWELAGKGSRPLGLHAAPALIGLILERGREAMNDTTLAEAAVEVDLAWRKSQFEELAATKNTALLPLSAALALSAASADEDDWKPAFTRRTGMDSTAPIGPIELGVQIYRERLVRALLKD